MDLFAIWDEQRKETNVPVGGTDPEKAHVDPAAMAAWADDSIESRQERAAGRFE
jgi:hypothetical protein